MECTQSQQFLPDCELSPLTKRNRRAVPKQIDVYDRKSAELHRHLASEKAIRELERRRDRSLIAVQRMSFFR
ncbi:MAG: hypothetical protein ACFFEV_00820 [Candidatus Thorarchaeota archaeon]